MKIVNCLRNVDFFIIIFFFFIIIIILTLMSLQLGSSNRTSKSPRNLPYWSFHLAG
jgi:hypothetical protein